ncbi:hypothetical protein J4Q44_G00262080 [Coregonus suidteri]|uniref:Uncharacterized protein n=1 Tax=Coregonus suidteri TaxID=861788 RepID=A0AAN8QFI0_9TELE
MTQLTKQPRKLGATLQDRWCCRLNQLEQKLTDQHIKELQFTAGPYEHSVWGQMGATKGPDELWRCHDGRLVAPANLCPELIREAHGPTHEGKLKTLQKLSGLDRAANFSPVERVLQLEFSNELSKYSFINYTVNRLTLRSAFSWRIMERMRGGRHTQLGVA